MANPSHSTASPDPRNPDTSLNSQPVTPAKAGVHVDAGLDSGFRRNDGGVNGNDGGGGNPEQTSNSVRPEPVEGPDGRSDFDILLRQGYGGQALSQNGILDRRTLLRGEGSAS